MERFLTKDDMGNGKRHCLVGKIILDEPHIEEDPARWTRNNPLFVLYVIANHMVDSWLKR